MQITTLILTAGLVIYTVGLLFLFSSITLNTDKDEIDNNLTFITKNSLKFNSLITDIDALAIVVYFTMTTLAKIGYGDFVAISNWERLMACVMLFISIAFFSYLIDNLTTALLSNP